MLSTASNSIGEEQSPSTTFNAGQYALIADWLASVFIAPLPAQALEALLYTEEADALSELGGALGIVQTSDQMRQALLAVPTASVTTALACRYTVLFEGVSGRRTVLLCESAWHGERARLFQAPFTEMQGILRRLDVSVGGAYGEPADHVSVQLAALAIALRIGDHDTAKALRSRLLNWFPQVAGRLATEDPGGFYAGAATMLIAFVTHSPEQRFPVIPPTRSAIATTAG